MSLAAVTFIPLENIVEFVYSASMSNQYSIISKKFIAAAFSAAANTYDQAAYVEQQVAARLLERLNDFKIQPQRILDLGCGTGQMTQQLRNLYPAATIIGVDIAMGMVNFASKYDNGIKYCCGDAEQLPFAKQSFDLVISNCSLMSMPNLSQVCAELQRITTIDGLILFTTFGPDTLKEFEVSLPWFDMHSIGDALLHAQLRDPVVETETLTFTYVKLMDLLQDLNETGTYQIDPAIFTNLDLPCSATFEIIYGHAWGNKQQQFKDATGKVFVAIDSITHI